MMTSGQSHKHGSWSWVIVRIAGIVLSPRRTFAKVAYESTAWLPIVIISLALLAVRFIILPDYRQQLASVEQEFMQNAEPGAERDSAQVHREFESIRRILPIGILLGSPVSVLANILVIALLLHATAKLLFRSTLRFTPVFNMVAWASVVSALQLILQIPLKLVDPTWDLPTNLAALVPVDLVGAYIHGVLMLTDLFLIWQVYLLGVGFSELYRISLQKSINIVGTMYVTFIVLNALLIAMTGNG